MAPNNDSVGAGRSSALKPARRSRIEPVIPLPFLQRRPKATSSATTPSPLRSNNENTPPHPKPQPEDTLDPRPASSTTISNLKESAGNSTEKMNGATTEKQVTVVVPKKSEDGYGAVTTGKPGDEPSFNRGAIADIVTQSTPTTSSQTPGDTTPADTVPSAPSSAAFAAPLANKSPPSNMPPAFHPTGGHVGLMRGPIPEPIMLPTHPFNQPQLHQHQQHHHHHPSNGSMVFAGGFQGSNTSSPIPHSGGMFPPPMPMSHESVPVTGIDSFGRPVLATAPIDPHVQVPMNHGPLTPHSFPGSQTSPNEDFVGKPMTNGINGEAARTAPLVGHSQDSIHNRLRALRLNKDEIDAALDFTEYIGSLFARPEFADCEVVLGLPDCLSSINSQFPGTPNGPLRLPAHQMILSHNPVLRQITLKLMRQGHGPREVRLASDDPFLRADAIWRAIEHIYGSCYIPMPAHILKQPDIEKFHFALGYAAAGSLLRAPSVSSIAVKEACMLLSWDTVEKGLEFALLGLRPQPQGMPIVGHLFPFFSYRHGSFMAELVEKSLFFIIQEFPENFVLDNTVDDPRYARLPSHSTENRPSPILNGAANHANAGQVASRKANINIKFGDMEPNENGFAPAGTSQPSTGRIATLSQILLNLPFEMVKMVLESNGLGGGQRWANIQDRRRFMSDVIAAREARRLRFISELTTGGYKGPVPIEGLRSTEPRVLEGTWSNVCWKEECLPSPDVAMIGRKWDPVAVGS